MKKINNPNNYSVEYIKQALEKTLGNQYEYDIRDNAIFVRKSAQVQLNVLRGDAGFFVLEAVPFAYRAVGVFVVFGILTLLFAKYEVGWTTKVPSYLVAYFASGFLADTVYRLAKQGDYADFKPHLISTLENIAKA